MLQPWEGNVAPRVQVHSLGAIRAVSVSPKRTFSFVFKQQFCIFVSATLMLMFAANAKLQNCCYKAALKEKLTFLSILQQLLSYQLRFSLPLV